MGAAKPMPTEAKIARFVRAVSKANPGLSRIRMTADGELIAEKGGGPVVAQGGDYDILPFGK